MKVRLPLNSLNFQILTTRFENLRMQESETISEFNSRLCDITNEAFALGEKISEETLVRKALRSLLQRFAYKVLLKMVCNPLIV